MRGRRGLLSDYIAAIRGTMAMRQARGQVRIELAFAGAAAVVALAGFHAAFLQTNVVESADRARSALGLLGESPDRGLTIGDGDGFVVTEGESGPVDAAEGPATTGPDGTPVETPGTGVLPSGGATPAEGSPGSTGDGADADAGPGDGEGEGGTETSLPPTSTTEPGTSTTDPGTSTSSTEPPGPGTTPTTAPPPSGGLVNDLLDLLGL